MAEAELVRGAAFIPPAIGIVPAHECLETRDVTGLKRNDWLIMKDQLVSFHSHLEARFQMNPGEGPGM